MKLSGIFGPVALLLAAFLLGFTAHALGQSFPAPSGEGPQWGWMAGVFLAFLVIITTSAIRGIVARIEKLEKQVQHISDTIATEHLDKSAVKETIQTSIRLAFAEQLPAAIRPLAEAVADLKFVVNSRMNRREHNDPQP